MGEGRAEAAQQIGHSLRVGMVRACCRQPAPALRVRDSSKNSHSLTTYLSPLPSSQPLKSQRIESQWWWS